MRGIPDISREQSGTAAMEFAFVAPIMIVILFGLVEFPRAFGVDQSLSRSARTMADLISRGSTNDASDIYAAGGAVTYPYDTSSAAIILTAVGVYQNGSNLESRACSSIAKNATAYAANKVLGVPPPSAATAGARYVMAEVSLSFSPLLNVFPSLKGLTFSKAVPWPTRGTGANTNAEIVLPGGKACPAS